tara:strand:+ start:136 stop:483 length:348 start_codon:yes stop_codon:yes gene_type:complete
MGLLLKMSKLVDQSPSSRNKGNTSKVKTKTHIYPRKNRWRTVWSDTPVSGVRRNLIDKKIGKKIIDEFKNGFSSIQLEEKYNIDNDTILRFVKKSISNDEFDRIEKKRVNQHTKN